jgi:phosphohistidine phosphatase
MGMKRLVLVRHAKAVQWGYENDFSRDLTDRGKRDAQAVSDRLLSLGVHPGMIISSPANRAWQTSEVFAKTFNLSDNLIHQKDDLYEGLTTVELIEFLHSFPVETDCVFLFGHNPSFEYYARGLCSAFDREMPTAAAVVIDFDTSEWNNISSRSGKLFLFVNPKSLNFE